MPPRRRLPPGAREVVLPSGQKRIELVIDVGPDPVTGRRRQTRKRYRTVDQAIDAYSKIKKETRDGTYVGQSAITVAEAIEAWLLGRRLRPSTLANYRQVLKPVARAYGALPLQKLTKAQVDHLVMTLQNGEHARADRRASRKWTARSVNLMLTVLGMVFEDAQKQGLVVRNVAKLVDRVPQTKKEMLTFTPLEVKRVLAKARRDRLEHAWHLGLSGLRRGEVCGLRWDDIDFRAKTLTIHRSRVVVDGHAIEDEPKSERSKRRLPLTPELVAVLKRARRRQAAERLRVGEAYVDEGFIVRDEVGRPLHPETVSDHWDRLLRAADIRRIRFHDARHTCGTLMHLEGVPIAVIAAWLGHADSSFTMRTYVHSQDDALAEAARVLGDVTRR